MDTYRAWILSLRAVMNENWKNASGSKKWWDTVNKITGRKPNHGSLTIDHDSSIINSYFQKINTDDNYMNLYCT